MSSATGPITFKPSFKRLHMLVGFELNYTHVSTYQVIVMPREQEQIQFHHQFIVSDFNLTRGFVFDK